MNKIQITLNEHVDHSMIEAAIDGSEPFGIDIINNYQATSEPLLTIDISDLDPDYQQALINVIDAATWSIETAATVFVIDQLLKTFNLEGSYVRDEISSEEPLSAVDAGTPLRVRFIVPGFETETVRDIDLWYGQAFNPVDVAALAEIGIELTGDGSEFTIGNVTECKVAFSRPETVEEVYVISYNRSGEIIPV